MAGKKLAVTTIVTGEPNSGQAYTVLSPGDTVPSWATDQVGDHCFDKQPDVEPDATVQADETVTAARKAPARSKSSDK